MISTASSLDEKLLRVHRGEGRNGVVGKLWSSEERSDEQSPCCVVEEVCDRVGKSDANGRIDVLI